MTQEQLDLLVRLMREVVLFETGKKPNGPFGQSLEETYAYEQCVRHLVNSTEHT